MTSQENQTGLPTWAKILIALAVVGIVGLIAMGVGTYFILKNTLIQDPAEIKRMAGRIATFEEPLPAGYSFNMGVRLLGTETVAVEHRGDQQMIFVISYPKADSDPQSVVNKVSETGVDTGASKTQVEKVSKKGQEIVGGETMPYIIGTMMDKGGNHEGMFGCVVPKDKHKTIFIYAAQPAGAPYNFPVTQGFLKAIKAFN